MFLDNGVRIMGPPEEVRRTVTAIRTAKDDKGELIVKARIKDSR